MLTRIAKLAVLSAALFGVMTPAAGWCAIDGWSWSVGQPTYPKSSADNTWWASNGYQLEQGTNTYSNSYNVPTPWAASSTTVPSNSMYIHGQRFPGVTVPGRCEWGYCQPSNMYLTWESEIADTHTSFILIVNDLYLHKNGSWVPVSSAIGSSFPLYSYGTSDANFLKLFNGGYNPSTVLSNAAIIGTLAKDGSCPTGKVCKDPTNGNLPFLTSIIGLNSTMSGVKNEPVWTVRVPVGSYNCQDGGYNYALIYDSWSDCTNQPGYTCMKNKCPVSSSSSSSSSSTGRSSSSSSSSSPAKSSSSSSSSSSPAKSSSSSSSSIKSSSSSTGGGNVRGDPQFAGLRGQDYQVHGIDGGVYNVISDKHMQLNSKFVFLTGPRPCPIMPTTGLKSVACFAHSGSYLQNLALLTSAGDRLLIESGTAANGLSLITVNDVELTVGQTVQLAFADGRIGHISYNSTHEVTLRAGLFEMEVENSDSFLNLRAVRVTAADWHELKAEQAHGLLGQTWKVRIGKSAIEGKVDDYLLESEDMFGTDFMYNRYGVATQE